MTEPADLIAMYVQLARVSGLRGRLYVQDRLLLCAALIAAQVDLPKTAACCRQRILQHNPQHWVGRFATVADAIADDDSLGLIRQAQRRYPPERAEQLYNTLGLVLEEERERHSPAAHSSPQLWARRSLSLMKVRECCGMPWRNEVGWDKLAR